MLCMDLGLKGYRFYDASWKVESLLEPDKHGKHNHHPTVGEDVKELVREHIRSYPSRHCHYSRKDNSERMYLPAELSIARLHQNFLEKP